MNINYYICRLYSANMVIMKKILLGIIVLIIGAVSLEARPVDRFVAFSVAQKYAIAQFAMERVTPELVYMGEDEAFYVYNVGASAFVGRHH